MNYSKLLACLMAVAFVSACSKTEGPAEDGSATMTDTASTSTSDGGIPISAPSDAANALYMDVRRLADKGDFIAANQAARKLTEDYPDFAGGWIMLGNTALSGPQFVQATTRAVELSEDGSDAQRLWSAMNMTFITNDSEEGLSLAKQLTEMYPDSYRAWLIYGGYLGFQNQIGEARTAIGTAVKLAPEQAVTHNALAFSYLNNDPKDFDKAEMHFGHAIGIEPNEDNHQVNMGDVHRAMGDLDAARSDYAGALELDPENATAAVKLGHVNSFLGNYEEARANYDMGIAAGQEGNKSTLANYRAFVSIHAGDPDAAVEELKGELVRIDTLEMPEDQKIAGRNFILTNLADVCFHNEMLDDAASAVEQLTGTMAEAGRNSDDANFARQQDINAAFWRGKLAARQGDYDAARAEAETFASLAAEDTNPRKLERYHELLGLIAIREGDNESAIAHYRRANLSTSPGSGDVKNIYMLATALQEAGRNEEAEELMQQVANWNFNSVWFAMLKT